ncbi:MAG: hypothetical protein AAF589_00065 [Planctomycetota bacterium]
MIHFTCDGCRRSIDVETEPRYVVRLEVYAAIDDEPKDGSDRDQLEEIDDLLERMDDPSDQAFDEDAYRQVRYDLCGDCRSTFLKNPLGRMRAAQVGFSEN